MEESKTDANKQPRLGGYINRQGNQLNDSDQGFTSLSNRDNGVEGDYNKSDDFCQSNPNTPGAKDRPKNRQVIASDVNNSGSRRISATAEDEEDQDCFSASTSNNNSSLVQLPLINIGSSSPPHRQAAALHSTNGAPLLSGNFQNLGASGKVNSSSLQSQPKQQQRFQNNRNASVTQEQTNGGGQSNILSHNSKLQSSDIASIQNSSGISIGRARVASEVASTTNNKKEKRRGSIKKKTQSLLMNEVGPGAQSIGASGVIQSQQQPQILSTVKQTAKKKKSSDMLDASQRIQKGSTASVVNLDSPIKKVNFDTALHQRLEDIAFRDNGYDSSSQESSGEEDFSETFDQSSKTKRSPKNRTEVRSTIQKQATLKSERELKLSKPLGKIQSGSSRVRDNISDDGGDEIIDSNEKRKLITKRDRRYSEEDIGALVISKDLIPPPEPLLPKTIAPTEPLRSGAPTPFLKLKPFISIKAEVPCKQTEEPVDKNKYKIDNAILNEQSLKTLFIQEFRTGDSNPVVYNRYSTQFGQQNQVYQNSAYQLLKSEANPMTLLVNVKELISIEPGKGSSPGSIVLPYYTPNDENDKTLVFESRFESGNLAMAFKLSDTEYNLVLSNDINTKGHTQWFFFRVTNTKKDLAVKFNILNHTKPDSLFNQGMKVLVFSEQINKDTGLGWHRDGRDIAYFQNNFKKDSIGRSRYFYTLTFTYDFKHDEDTLFFAYSYPYTYTDLVDDLTAYERDHVKNEYISRNVLCRTIAGNKCEYLTITAKNHPDVRSIITSMINQQKQERKGVFLSSRIHPGESNASWMMKGILDFLVSQAPEARVLREKFVFKIVPMLNPDGVINGNYRCSLAGADLNRRWKTTSKLLFPEVFETKKLCKQFQKERQIVLYCDLHGHSRNKDIFIYGNNYSENPESTRLFPFIMSKVLDSFSYDASRFSIHKSKESTARVSMWRELKIPAVYTMEASFCGPSIGKNAGLHFTTEHFMESGKKLMLALLIYCDVDVPKALKDLTSSKQKRKKETKDQSTQSDYGALLLEIAPEIKEYTRKGLIAELMGNKNLLNAGSKDDDDEGGGSESDPSEDNMEEEEMAKIMPMKVNAAKKKVDPKRQLPVRKQFKQEEAKDQKQQTLAKKSPTKKINHGGSFFDRVRLPKSYGMRRVEMVDAWTQTSNRGSDNEEAKNKDEGTQAQSRDMNGQDSTNIDVSPTRPRRSLQNSSNLRERREFTESPDKQMLGQSLIAGGASSLEQQISNQKQTHPGGSMFNIDSIRNNLDSNASQSVIVQNPNKNRILVPSSQKRQSLSPNKNEFTAIRDRMQAMQIINQYIKDSHMTGSTAKPNNGNLNLPQGAPGGLQFSNDPYNFFLQQQQQQQQFYTPDKNPSMMQGNSSNHAYNTEKKPSVINQLQMSRPQVMDDSVLIHKRQSSNNPQHYYFDSNQPQPNTVILQQIQMTRGLSDNSSALQQAQSSAGPSLAPLTQANQRTLEFNKELVALNQLSQQQAYINNQQTNRIGAAAHLGINSQNNTSQNPSINNSQNATQNINLRSLSGNTYLRSMKQRPDEYNGPVAGPRLPLQGTLGMAGGHSVLSHNSINNNMSLQNQSQKNQNNSSFNQHMMQTGNGNSRATTLPQLNNDSMQKSQSIKQNKSQSFYEGIKAQNSFKAGPPSVSGQMPSFKNDYKGTVHNTGNNLGDDQFFNSSFAKGNVSPVPFENMPHYSFKIKPTMIVGASSATKSSSKQLNSSQLHNSNSNNNESISNTNDTKRMYQSQPQEEFTPKSTQLQPNQEQISGMSQKWNSKNRAHHNLNTGGAISAGGSQILGMTHTSSGNKLNSSFALSQSQGNNQTVSSLPQAQNKVMGQNKILSSQPISSLIAGGASTLQVSLPASQLNQSSSLQNREQTIIQSSQMAVQSLQQQQQIGLISKKQRKPSESLGSTYTNQQKASIQSSQQEGSSSSYNNQSNSSNNNATSKSFVQSSNTPNLFLGGSSAGIGGSALKAKPKPAQQAAAYRKNKL